MGTVCAIVFATAADVGRAEGFGKADGSASFVEASRWTSHPRARIGPSLDGAGCVGPPRQVGAMTDERMNLGFIQRPRCGQGLRQAVLEGFFVFRHEAPRPHDAIDVRGAVEEGVDRDQA